MPPQRASVNPAQHPMNPELHVVVGDGGLFMVNSSFDRANCHLPFCRWRAGRSDQRRSRRWKLHRFSRTAVLRSAAGSRQRHEYIRIVVGSHRERRGVPETPDHHTTHPGAAARGGTAWRTDRSHPFDSHAGGNFPAGTALVVAGRHAAVCLWTAYNREAGGKRFS